MGEVVVVYNKYLHKIIVFFLLADICVMGSYRGYSNLAGLLLEGCDAFKITHSLTMNLENSID